ncbi:MAG: hypothetical protein J6586_12465 [Snodgrassella sp.]|nr:hypothetical protein [Snodgrassella sp.]
MDETQRLMGEISDILGQSPTERRTVRVKYFTLNKILQLLCSKHQTLLLCNNITFTFIH